MRSGFFFVLIFPSSRERELVIGLKPELWASGRATSTTTASLAPMTGAAGRRALTVLAALALLTPSASFCGSPRLAKTRGVTAASRDSCRARPVLTCAPDAMGGAEAPPLPVVQLNGPRFADSFLPLLTAALRGQSHRYMVELMNEWGENFVVRFPLPWSRWVFLNEPMAIRALLEDVNPEKSADFTRGLDAIAKGGLLTADWSEWLQERRRCAPTMTERYVGDLHKIFEEEAAFLHARLEHAAASGDPIEMDGALVGTLFDVIARITIGRSLDFRADAASQTFTTSIEHALEEAMRRIVLPPGGGALTALTPDGQKFRRAMREINGLLDDCVRQRLGKMARASPADSDPGRQADPTPTSDLLGVLLEAHTQGVLSIDQVKAQLLTFLLAGHDTTAHTLTWMLWEVARAPSLQDALAAEARRVLPSRTDFPDKGALSKLEALDRAWQETLRKHPVAATGTLRQVAQTVTVPTATGTDGVHRGAWDAAARLEIRRFANPSYRARGASRPLQRGYSGADARRPC